MDSKKDNEKVKSMIQGVGATAEMSLIFYRAAIDAGATPEEASRLTQAYLAAIFYGNRQLENEGE